MHYALRHFGIPTDKLKHLLFFLRREMAVKMNEDVRVVADPHGAMLDGLTLGFGGRPQVRAYLMCRASVRCWFLLLFSSCTCVGMPPYPLSSITHRCVAAYTDPGR